MAGSADVRGPGRRRCAIGASVHQPVYGPELVLAGGAVLTDLFCAAPLTFAGGTPHLDARGITLLAGCLALGFAGLAGASAASRPLLRTVVADAGPRPD